MLCFLLGTEDFFKAARPGCMVNWGTSMKANSEKNQLVYLLQFLVSVVERTLLPGVIPSFHVLQGLGKTRLFPFGGP